MYTLKYRMFHISLRMIIMAYLLIVPLYGNIFVGYLQVKRTVGGTDPSLWDRQLKCAA